MIIIVVKVRSRQIRVDMHVSRLSRQNTVRVYGRIAVHRYQL